MSMLCTVVMSPAAPGCLLLSLILFLLRGIFTILGGVDGGSTGWAATWALSCRNLQLLPLLHFPNLQKCRQTAGWRGSAGGFDVAGSFLATGLLFLTSLLAPPLTTLNRPAVKATWSLLVVKVECTSSAAGSLLSSNFLNTTWSCRDKAQNTSQSQAGTLKLWWKLSKLPR